METDTCRERLAPYCKGAGIDIGFGGYAIEPSAVCLDRSESNANRKNPYASATHLIGDPAFLSWFKDSTLDYVYSSHCLADFYDTKKVLLEWLRVIKPGGFLVLFLPDEQVYRSVTPEEVRNKGHQHEHFSLEFVKTALNELGYTEANIIHQLWPVPNNLYSFDLVVQKPVLVPSGAAPTDEISLPEPPSVPKPMRKLNVASFENRKIVQLGRYGDLINILPIAKDIAAKIGKPVPIICKKDYADILDGVSYAVAEIAPGADFTADMAKDFGVLDTHAAHPTSPRRIPYNLQAWEQVGYEDRFQELFPVFDRRCRIREVSLVESLVTFEKPVMLVALHGLSSALTDNTRSIIKKLIHESFGRQFQVIDLSIKAQRPYDLLGLLDVASVLITIDSMLLHLATATNVPVVAFLSNHPPIFWRASSTKGNVVYRALYDKVVDDWDCVVRAVETHKRQPLIPSSPVFHVVPLVEPAGEAAVRRYKAAQVSWQLFHQQGAVFLPYLDQNSERMFLLGDRKLPYLKDALKTGLEASSGNKDIICFTNADIILSPGFYKALQKRMAVNDFCCSFRMEFEPTDGDKCGVRTHGRDMFAFKRLWLAQHFDEIPDFLIGVGGWDYALAMWFRVLSGRSPESCDPSQCMPDIEMEYGFVWHERHEASWFLNTETIYAEAANHNRACIREFFDRLGLEQAHKDIK